MGAGIYLAGAAMIARQVRQEAMVHNLANTNTPGYKATRVFAKVLDDVSASVDAMRNAERDQEVYIDFSQGPIQRTGRDLDFALEGEGFFVVLTPEGERFTRNGNFTLDAEGRLVNSLGHPVMTEVGPVTLKDESETGVVEVNEEGEIFVSERIAGRLLIRHFVSLDDLRKESMGLFAPEPGRTLQETEPTARVHQGYLEESNVFALEEMVRMMSQFSNYEASYRTVEMQNNALKQTVNDLITR